MSGDRITLLVRFSSKDGTQTLEIDQDDKLDILFKRLSEQLSIEIPYLTFTFNGKQFRHDSDDKKKSLKALGLFDRSIIFVVSRVKGGIV